jgi:hypothetical protein
MMCFAFSVISTSASNALLAASLAVSQNAAEAARQAAHFTDSLRSLLRGQLGGFSCVLRGLLGFRS